MQRHRAPRAAAFAALAFVIASSVLGCGNKDGRQVATEEQANLVIHNTTNDRVAVYVGDSRQDAAAAGRVGEVEPVSTGYFKLRRRDHKVYVRRHGESFFFAKESVNLGPWGDGKRVLLTSGMQKM
jgi:hypothetical protein